MKAEQRKMERLRKEERAANAAADAAGRVAERLRVSEEIQPPSAAIAKEEEMVLWGAEPRSPTSKSAAERARIAVFVTCILSPRLPERATSRCLAMAVGSSTVTPSNAAMPSSFSSVPCLAR